MKMSLRALWTALATLPLCACASLAQQPPRRATLPAAPAPAAAPAARPRVARAASPEPERAASAPASTAMPAPLYNVQQSYYYYTADGQFVVSGAPFVVLQDGSVLANFGNGYERVLRACAPPSPQAAAEPWGRDALGRIQDPPGIAALKAGARGVVSGRMPAQRAASACYTVAQNGQVLIGSPR